jgi:hypothetical protein
LSTNSKINNLKTDFLQKINIALSNNQFVKLTLSKFRGAEKDLQNIYVIPVRIKNNIKLSFRYKFSNHDIFKNYNFEDAVNLISAELGSNFLHCTLFTTIQDYILEYNKRRIPRTYSKKPSITKIEIKEQNRIKTRFIDSKSKYLNLLGITNQKGEIRNDKYDKFRQIDKFIEILSSLIEQYPGELNKQLIIIDYGSGKSYLTFAVYDYLSKQMNFNPVIYGIEKREDLVNLSNNAAAECKFKNLKFFSSQNYLNGIKSADIVIALHACDTATDEAILNAIKLNAKIIILAPCCHKYVRKKIILPKALTAVFKHNIFTEHISAFVTDGLRALTLNAYGYETKIFEFINPEHTSKNIMITAVKQSFGSLLNNTALDEIQNIKSQFSLTDFYLDILLTKLKLPDA